MSGLEGGLSGLEGLEVVGLKSNFNFNVYL